VRGSGTKDLPGSFCLNWAPPQAPPIICSTMVSVQTLSLQRQVLIKPQAFRASQHQKPCTSSFAYLPLGGGRAAFSTTCSCQGSGSKEEPWSRLRLRRRLVTFLPSGEESFKIQLLARCQCISSQLLTGFWINSGVAAPKSCIAESTNQ
jgi:hypothetical protein